MSKYLFINYETWGDIMDGFVSQLKKLKELSGVYEFTHIYSPPRGGLPIAVHLSHHLDLKMIIDFDTYMDHDIKSNDNILIIDDIIDTGKTFSIIKRNLESIIETIPTIQYKFTALYYKPRAIVKPSIYVNFYKQEVPDDTWVVFPFEKNENCEEEREDFLKRRLLNDNEETNYVEA